MTSSNDKEIAFTKVRLPFGWMSNMSPHPVWATSMVGIVWRTAEAFFQAHRFAVGDPIREEIWKQTSPMAAKMVAKREVKRMMIQPQSGADLNLMLLTLRRKVTCHYSLKKMLLETGEAQIIEDCSNRPHGSGLFWGAERIEGGWRGANNLGHLWERVREELRQQKER